MSAVRDTMPTGDEPIITVVNATPYHARALGDNQRARDVELANMVGIPAHRVLWRVYRKSLVAKAVLVNGEVVAMFGVAGIFLSKVGKPWFIASPFVEDYPMKLAFRYRSELKNMLRLFPILEDLVWAYDDKTLRLLEIIGFKFDAPKTINGIPFIRATLER